MSPTKQAIIQKVYGDIIVGQYYNLQMRGANSDRVASDMQYAAMLYDPVLFAEDNGERDRLNQMLRANSRPQREARPMYIGADGKLHYKYESNFYDPHQNRMMAILNSKSVDSRTPMDSGRRSPNPSSRPVTSNFNNSKLSNSHNFSSMSQQYLAAQPA